MKKLSMLLALLLLLCCLTGCGGAGKSTNQTDAEELCTYTVSCLGQNGERVEGVMINFCTDSMCTPVISDEQGEAVFTGPAASATATSPTQSRSRRAGNWPVRRNGSPSPAARASGSPSGR